MLWTWLPPTASGRILKGVQQAQELCDFGKRFMHEEVAPTSSCYPPLSSSAGTRHLALQGPGAADL